MNVIWNISALVLAGVVVVGGQDRFIDRSAAFGLNYPFHVPAERPNRLPETFTGRAIPFDFDRDGDQDLLLTYGPRRADTTGMALNRLYRNTGQSWEDITYLTGLHLIPPAVNAAIGDYDGDGFLDIYLTRLGPDILLHNEGGQALLDVTADSGIDNPAWSSSALFLDANLDGALDIYVANYLAFPIADTMVCRAANGEEEIVCAPEMYPPARDRLYLNDGSGRFSDHYQALGLADTATRSIAVQLLDANADNRLDILVLAHRAPNRLYLFNTDTTYSDAGWSSGMAVAPDGTEPAWKQALAWDADAAGGTDLLLITEGGDLEILLNHGSGLYFPGLREAGLYRPGTPFSATAGVLLSPGLGGGTDLLLAVAGNDSVPPYQYLLSAPPDEAFLSEPLMVDLTVDSLLAVPVAESLSDSVFDEFLGDVTGPDFSPLAPLDLAQVLPPADTLSAISLVDDGLPEAIFPSDSALSDSGLSDSLAADSSSMPDSTASEPLHFDPAQSWATWDTLDIRQGPAEMVLADLDNDGVAELLATYPARLLKIWGQAGPSRPSYLGLILRSDWPGGTIIGARVDVVTRLGIQHVLVIDQNPLLIYLPPRTRLVELHVTWPDGLANTYQVTALNRYYTLTRQEEIP